MYTFEEKQKKNHLRIRELRARATESELKMCAILDKLNVKYIFQKGFLKGNAFVIVDFYIKKWKMCLEIDGEYHFTDKQRSFDNWRDNYLKERGFTVLRIKNSEVDNFKFPYLLRLKNMI